MKVANNIAAKQTYEKQLKLPCQKLNLQKKKKELTKSMDNRLWTIIEKKDYFVAEGILVWRAI